MTEIKLTKDILDQEISDYNIEEVCDEMVFNEDKTPSSAAYSGFFEFLNYIENKYDVESDYEIDDEYYPILWDYIVENLSDVINFQIEVGYYGD